MANRERSQMMSGVVVVVRGVGDIGSAIAHRLFRDGCAVAMHDDSTPTTTRRGMAFADAVFDGRASLEDVEAVRATEFSRVKDLLATRQCVPVYVGALDQLLKGVRPAVLVDARMRKHSSSEIQRGLADFTVGLGPDLSAGLHADVVIETSWDDLGRIITTGASLPLFGQPRAIEGHARDRYVYAPSAGVFHTKARIGDLVCRGDEVAKVGSTILTAPLDGALRGLTRDGVPVAVRTKVIEIDPRGAGASITGIAERPRRIAEGVSTAIQTWKRGLE
jgi:xanthine dehydrogenase accessory factor